MILADSAALGALCWDRDPPFDTSILMGPTGLTWMAFMTRAALGPNEWAPVLSAVSCSFFDNTPSLCGIYTWQSTYTIAGGITSFNSAARLSFSANLAAQFPGVEPGTLNITATASLSIVAIIIVPNEQAAAMQPPPPPEVLPPPSPPRMPPTPGSISARRRG